MEDELLSRRAFADVIGKSHTWVADKIKDESITLQGGKIPKNRALEELKGLGLIGSGSKKEKNTGQFPPVLQSKAKYEFFKAQKMEIEVEALKGNIYHKEQLSKDLSRIIGAVQKGCMRSSVMAYSSKHDKADTEEFIDRVMDELSRSEEIEEVTGLMVNFGLSPHQHKKGKK